MVAPIASVDNFDDAVVMAIIGAVGALILLIVSFAFLKNEPKDSGKSNWESLNFDSKNIHQTKQAALPSPQNQPAQSYVSPANSWKAPNTSELFQPRSVTEGTTKLLENREK
jgi:sugar phosphate permease